MSFDRTRPLTHISLRPVALCAAFFLVACGACTKNESANSAVANTPEDNLGGAAAADQEHTDGSAGVAQGGTGSGGDSAGGGNGGNGRNAATPDDSLATEEIYVDHDGLRHYVRVRGKGPHALFVLNGGPGQSHHYCRSTDALASSELRIVTYDQRGSGQTAHPADRDYSHNAYADDLDAIRRHLGLERIHLLGHSNGGLLALAYTARHTEHVASLQLYGSSPATGTEADSEEFEARIARFEAEGAFPPGYDQFGNSTDCAPYFKTIWPVYLHDSEWPAPELVQQTACDLRAFSGSSRSNGERWDVTGGLQAFTGPVSVYYGESDPFRKESETIAAHFANTEPVVSPIPACGHYWEECDDVFFPQAAAFIADHL